jgi:uncharacterized protein YjbI with pentapeptide repeats
MPKNPPEALRPFLDSLRTARGLAFKAADLRGLRLSGLRADGLDLEEADLRETILTKVNWKGCVLSDARLDGADLTDAVLRLCDLDQARATNATLVRARLENSTARGARFDGARLTEAVLTDTDFSRASFVDANLAGVSASGADFRGADLRGAVLRDAVLADADLRGADLTGADLTGADLSGADLRGVVGDDPALQEEESRSGGLPLEMRNLAETMAPIVVEVLRTAGERGVMDRESAERLIGEAARYRGASSENTPSPDTVQTVSRLLDEIGDGLPALIGSLRQPQGSEPPPEVKALILRLREVLSLDEAATAEDVLARLMSPGGEESH